MAEKRVGIELVINSKGDVKIRQAGKELTTLGKKGQKASAALNKGFVAAGNRINQFAKRVFSLKTAIISLAGAGGLGYVGKSFIDASAEVEAFEARLISLTKSEEIAQQKLQYMLEYAKRTPFELSGIIEAGVQAEAFGLKIEKNLEQLGDLAAFMDVDMTQAASALGRAYAAGAGAADMLRDRGVLQLVKELAKLKYGIEDISKLTLPEFRQVLLETISDPMGKISGATERLAKTFKGQMSMMSDAIFNAKRAIGDALMPVVQDLLEIKIIPLVGEFEAWARANQEIIQQKFEDTVNAIASSASKLKDALPDIVEKTGSLVTYISDLISDFNSLPGWVKTTGLLSGFFFGVKGPAAFLAAAPKLAEAQLRGLKGAAEDYMRNIRSYQEQIARIKLEAPSVSTERLQEALNQTRERLRETLQKIQELENIPNPFKVTEQGAWDLAQAYQNLGVQIDAVNEKPSKPPAPVIAPEIVGPTEEQLIAMKAAYEQQKAIMDQFALYGLESRERELAQLEQWYEEQQNILKEHGLLELEIEGRNLTYREALREEYINRMKDVETDLADHSIAESQRMLDELEQSSQQAADIGFSLGEILEQPLTDAFESIITGTKSVKNAFKDMGDAIAQEMAHIVAQQMAIQTLKLLLGGITGGIGAMGGGAFAQGGILPGPFMPITPMQYGGVYSRPTLGLIAEAGTPEAVVPLKGGAVPVRFVGDQPKAQRERPTYIVNAFSEEFMQQQINRALSQNAEVIVNMVQQDIMAGGSTYQLIRGLR